MFLVILTISSNLFIDILDYVTEIQCEILDPFGLYVQAFYLTMAAAVFSNNR